MANSTDTSVSYQIWLAQCAQTKPDALRQLYQHEAPHLLALGTSLLLRSTDAEELVRESFELIWRNAEGYEPTLGSARGWIYGVFRFKAQQRLKQKTTSNSFLKTKSRLIIPSNAPPELLQFQALDEKSRRVLALAYLHAYSYAEIAKVCQSTIKQTQEDLHKALEKLVQLSSAWKNQSNAELCLLGLYCLGLLREPHTVAPAQALLSTNTHASYDLLLWEDILSALTHTLAKPAVPPSLWLRICKDLNLALPVAPPAPVKLEPEPKPKLKPEPTPDLNLEPEQKFKTKAKIKSQRKAYWAASLAGLLLLIGLTVFALKPSAPVIQRIEMSPRAGAILQSPGQSSTPGWIVTVDPEGNVLLSPQVNTELKGNEVVQLWTQSPNNPTIRSLGLLNPNKPVTVPYEMIGETQVGQIFEMTLEPPKGSSTPTGAVLFIGKLVNFGEFSESN